MAYGRRSPHCQGSITSVDQAVAEAQSVADHGIPGVLLFGLPECKDPLGQEAYSPTGAVQQAVRAIKQAVPTLIVITDVCLCEYTDHGHCGVVQGEHIVNDLTLELSNVRRCHTSRPARIWSRRPT